MTYSRILTTLALLATAMSAVGADIQTGIIDFYDLAPYRNVNGKNRVFPLLIIHAGDFYFEGIELGYTLHEGEHTVLRLLATPTMLGYESDDSSYLEGMETRKEDFAAGAEFTYRFGAKRIAFQLTHDLSGTYESYGAKLEFALQHPVGSRMVLEPYAGVRHLSADKADYYFGVKQDEARVGRPAYHPQAGNNAYLGIKTVYCVDDNWSLLGNIEQRVLDSDIAASPIVEDSRAVSAYLGVTYQW
ncbi:MAG: MipA/OmpV family protein [Candidatus Thiodiazotropha sp.]